jgi:hypothetical protein
MASHGSWRWRFLWDGRKGNGDVEGLSARRNVIMSLSWLSRSLQTRNVAFCRPE